MELSELARTFNKAYYDHRKSWTETSWMGVRVMKNPIDLWTYQEILFELKPVLIIETGTRFGGSALFFAHMLDAMQQPGRVLTIDIEPLPNRPQHPRVQYLTGDSVSPAITTEVRHMARTASGPILISLDSNHEFQHVSKELELYSPLIRRGGVLVVEDTNLNGHPARTDFGPGPAEAVQRFLELDTRWSQERRWEDRHLITFNPGGVLRRMV